MCLLGGETVGFGKAKWIKYGEGGKLESARSAETEVQATPKGSRGSGYFQAAQGASLELANPLQCIWQAVSVRCAVYEMGFECCKASSAIGTLAASQAP